MKGKRELLCARRLKIFLVHDTGLFVENREEKREQRTEENWGKI